MDTTPNKSKSWNTLVTQARSGQTLPDIDVRVAVRRALEVEVARAHTEAPTNVWEELLRVAGTVWFRGVLGTGVVVAVTLIVASMSAINELLQAGQLTGLLGN